MERGYKVIVIKDAVVGIDKEKSSKLMEKGISNGVQIIFTNDIKEGFSKESNLLINNYKQIKRRLK
jgi:nicotinamidase-related amidase